MKINYVTNVRIPTTRAQGYAIMKMCEKFADNGTEVELFIPNRRDVDKLGEPFSYYGIKRNFSITTFRTPDLLGQTLFFGQLFYKIDMFFFLKNIRSTFKNEENSIFYTRDFEVVEALPKKSFICLEVHDIPKGNEKFKRAIQRPQLFFVLNINIKNALIEMGISSEKIFIFPSGVETSEFDIAISKTEARKKLSLPDKTVILYNGHLYPWKGVDTLAQVAIELPEYLFLFVGGMDPEYSNFVAKYKKYQNILIRPFEARSNMPLYIKAADVCVIPSPSKYEISSKYTSPMKLFEFMAGGRPIVASNLPSLREVLNDKNAIFAMADNPKSFASAIKKVVEDMTLQQSIVEESRRNVERYTWDNRAKNILSIIKSMSQE